MSVPPGDSQRDPRSVAEMAIDVSERVSFLVREEVELAKAEVTEKATALLKGSVVGIAAGVFALLGLAMIMHAFAWLLNDLFFGDTIWLGFLVEAVMWFIVAGDRRASSPTSRCRRAHRPFPRWPSRKARRSRKPFRREWTSDG